MKHGLFGRGEEGSPKRKVGRVVCAIGIDQRDL